MEWSQRKHTSSTGWGGGVSFFCFFTLRIRDVLIEKGRKVKGKEKLRKKKGGIEQRLGLLHTETSQQPLSVPAAVQSPGEF